MIDETTFPEMTEGLWLSSQPEPDGSYTAELSIDGDMLRSLDRDEGVRYARAVLQAAAAADYEQAMYAELRGSSLDTQLVGLLLSTLRNEREQHDYEATAPLRFVAGLSAEGKGFVALYRDDVQVGQLDPSAARQHAMAAMEMDVVCGLDKSYRKLLVDMVGLGDDKARATVMLLSKFRPPADERSSDQPTGET